MVKAVRIFFLIVFCFLNIAVDFYHGLFLHVVNVPQIAEHSWLSASVSE